MPELHCSFSACGMRMQFDIVRKPQRRLLLRLRAMNRSSVFSLLLGLVPCVLFAQANGRPSAAIPQASSVKVSDPVERGLAVFTGKGACLSCHEVRGHGSRLGPNLSEIGARSTRAGIRNSLL